MKHADYTIEIEIHDFKRVIKSHKTDTRQLYRAF